MRTSISYGAFHRPRLAAGVGMKTGTMIWGGALFVGSVLDSPVGFTLMAVIAGSLHLAIAWAFAKDHKLFEAYAMYVQIEDVYDAGISVKQNSISPRPKGFGKDIQC